MASNALVQARIDPAIKKKAAAVLKKQGMTVSDAVRVLLTRTATEGALPMTSDSEEYDKWFRAKVQRALNDERPPLSEEEVEEHFARRRTQALKRVAKAG